jgi:MFS superfamily sulfate permease-like transporter
MADNSSKKGNFSRDKFIENNRKITRKIGNVFTLFFCGALVIGLISSVIEFLRGFISEFISPDHLKGILASVALILVAYIICGLLFGFHFEDDD